VPLRDCQSRSVALAGLLLAALPGSAGAAPPPKTAPARPAPAPIGPPITMRKWTGDLDGMVKRRAIRALVVCSRTQYFVDRGQQLGTAYELMRAFEDHVNTKRKLKTLKVNVVFIPTSRDDLIPALREGRGDVALGGLTRTPERLKLVDFSAPFATDVSEIVVTGPASPAVKAVEDLSGQEVFVRRSSSYWEHLEALNTRLGASGKAPVKLRPAPDNLEDEDLLEMLNAGLVRLVVVDDYKARLWARMFKSIQLHPEAAVASGGEIGAMLRQGSPLLKAELAGFVKTHRAGTLFGNTVIKKYLGSTRFVKDATSPQEIKKFQDTVALFRQYGQRYDVDHLLVMAQSYQESRLDHAARSHVGAVGIMQVMPATGSELKVGDITKLEPNIHAGVKYIRFMIDRYFAGEPMDAVNKTLFAFASYNAGPARVARLRKEAQLKGLNPNVWFNNVETIAAARIGTETVTYVANIFKYYVAYRLVTEAEEERRKALEDVKKAS
jgi:membrane-bound lytic murein transglycosylase MltF